MSRSTETAAGEAFHSHVFLGEGHEKSERKTWSVIWLCAAMMVVEIVGGWLFGSIALVADGLHMSTHAGALLLAALAYTFARRYAHDERFTFGTGKLGDLAGFTSAIILAMIALLIGYEAVARLFDPVPIHFAEAIPVAFLGLAVNVASAWLLSGDHHHGHGHGHAHDHHGDDETRVISTASGDVSLEVFEDGVPPRFRLRSDSGSALVASAVSVETLRPDGSRQTFAFADRDGFVESITEIPEPHEFTADVTIGAEHYPVVFEEHEHAHGAAAHDNNMRAAIIHVIADAAVSVLVIIGLILAWIFGWLWMDAVAGIVGAIVIANWSASLIRDTSAILLDMNPDRQMSGRIRTVIEEEGDRLADLHVWRLGPGHLGAIVSVVSSPSHNEAFFRAKLARFKALSHLTIEIRQAG
ncbi:CDF family Co(II)/Ni(II) efflux transporter DmeF [Methylovirgula sp. 4M-Z18]|uniref:CDF family Co(II)/Ni(II) efflux transporter DmeF n=1 Tax=Methylovirgula sp. 4M-Z18 TaxID=2293567 RepID=UPI000E2FED13|nr:CDF family Co(II)/Ni(II) efflux transporter DmeF [Methylovirgula sp. 4M-Z18]RFB78475.1 cation transporter [Methylovirgula sp. 4M-Z18]